MGTDGKLGSFICNSQFDYKLYKAGNYCKDEPIMRQRALYKILNRLLWRYYMMQDGDKIDWADGNHKYYIFKNPKVNNFDVGATDQKTFDPVFYTRGIAESAIKEIMKPFMEKNPDFIW